MPKLMSIAMYGGVSRPKSVQLKGLGSSLSGASSRSASGFAVATAKGRLGATRAGILRGGSGCAQTQTDHAVTMAIAPSERRRAADACLTVAPRARARVRPALER